eukprot:PhM_4_TR2194/c0_g1_i1/m.41669
MECERVRLSEGVNPVVMQLHDYLREKQKGTLPAHLPLPDHIAEAFFAKLREVDDAIVTTTLELEDSAEAERGLDESILKLTEKHQRLIAERRETTTKMEAHVHAVARQLKLERTAINEAAREALTTSNKIERVQTQMKLKEAALQKLDDQLTAVQAKKKGVAEKPKPLKERSMNMKQ